MERCSVCRRKTVYLITCKCKKVVCIEHRDADDHSCEFDYKAEERERIIKKNPILTGKKMVSIDNE